MTDEKSVREALDLAGELGPITAAVNCAGIATAGLTFSKRGLGEVLVASSVKKFFIFNFVINIE